MARRNKQPSLKGPVKAVDCNHCNIRSDGVLVCALGLQNLSVKVKDGVVTIQKIRSREVGK